MSQLEEQITSAIGAHGLWKNRLEAAVASGTSDVDVNVVRDDHQCNFGKWLHDLNPGPGKNKSKHFRTCAELHRRFHIVASEILSLALTGKKEEAAEVLESGPEFCKLSTDLTNAMMAWKTAEARLSPAAH